MKNKPDYLFRDRKALKNGVTAVDTPKENIKPNGFFLTHKSFKQVLSSLFTAPKSQKPRHACCTLPIAHHRPST